MNCLVATDAPGAGKAAGPDNIKDIVGEWGRINKEHALNYVQNELARNPVEFEREFESYFRRRYRNFAALAKSYFSN